MKERTEKTTQANINSIPTSSTVPSQRYEKALETTVKKWSALLSNYPDAAACIILSTGKGGGRCSIFLRWHALPSLVLSGTLACEWSSWLSLSIQPRIKVQNVIPVDSPSAQACCRNDVLLMRECLSLGKAHPNDTTTKNHTLLHVRVI